jgi:hypothetical protein
MKRTGIIGLAAVVVLAVAVPAALAGPEWRKAGKALTAPVTFKTTSGAGHMIVEPFLLPKITVECSADKATGQIEGTNKASKVEITFTGCKGIKGTETPCPVKSPGAAAEEVKTAVLVGELGAVAKAEAPNTETGLDFKPASGASFVKLEGTCLPFEKSEVEGSIIGEVKPVKVEQTTGEVIFTETAKKQTIQSFVGGAKDTLSVFGGEARLTNTENVTFAAAVEVT